jgi:hypothetical protein
MRDVSTPALERGPRGRSGLLSRCSKALCAVGIAATTVLIPRVKAADAACGWFTPVGQVSLGPGATVYSPHYTPGLYHYGNTASPRYPNGLKSGELRLWRYNSNGILYVFADLYFNSRGGYINSVSPYRIRAAATTNHYGSTWSLYHSANECK